MKGLSLKKWLITILLLVILLIVTIIFCSFQGSADIKLKDLLEKEKADGIEMRNLENLKEKKIGQLIGVAKLPKAYSTFINATGGEFSDMLNDFLRLHILYKFLWN